MATAKHNPEKTRTQTVVVQAESFTLELTPREAQIIQALVAHTTDIDPKFPEVASIYRALRDAGAPDYYNLIDIVDYRTKKPIFGISLAEA